MKRNIPIIYMVSICLHLSAAHINDPTAQQPAENQSWQSYWQRAQQTAAPYAANAQNFWHTQAQPKLAQLGTYGWRALTGLGTAVNLVDTIRQDDPHLILAIHTMCKRPQLAYLWQYNPPALLTTWLLRKAYLKGAQAFANLSSQERIKLLKEELTQLDVQIDQLYNQADAYRKKHSLEDNLFTFNITQIADALQKKRDMIDNKINRLEKQATLPQPQQSWLGTARNYINAYWPKWPFN